MSRIYFLAPVGGGPIKIGCSDMPARRLREIQFWAPYPLEILASAVGTRKDERRVRGSERGEVVDGHVRQTLRERCDVWRSGQRQIRRNGVVRNSRR